MAGQFPQMQGAGGAANDDAITWLKAIANAIAQLGLQFAGLAGRTGTAGTFAWPAANVVTVANVNVKANSTILCFPANAAAGTLSAGATSPYAAPADFVAGVSFKVRTANAAAAAGTEIYHYQVLNLI